MSRDVRKALMIARHMAEGGEIDKNINTAPMTKPSYAEMMKSGATLPAAVDLARQLKPGRR